MIFPRARQHRIDVPSTMYACVTRSNCKRNAFRFSRQAHAFLPLLQRNAFPLMSRRFDRTKCELWMLCCVQTKRHLFGALTTHGFVSVDGNRKRRRPTEGENIMLSDVMHCKHTVCSCTREIAPMMSALWQSLLTLVHVKNPHTIVDSRTISQTAHPNAQTFDAILSFHRHQFIMIRAVIWMLFSDDNSRVCLRSMNGSCANRK